MFFVFMKIIETMHQHDTNEHIFNIVTQLNTNVLQMYTEEKFSKMTA